MLLMLEGKVVLIKKWDEAGDSRFWQKLTNFNKMSGTIQYINISKWEHPWWHWYAQAWKQGQLILFSPVLCGWWKIFCWVSSFVKLNKTNFIRMEWGSNEIIYVPQKYPKRKGQLLIITISYLQHIFLSALWCGARALWSLPLIVQTRKGFLLYL